MHIHPLTKQILISIFVGATVAFLTTMLEGLLDFFQGPEHPIIGGIVGAAHYFRRWKINLNA